MNKLYPEEIEEIEEAMDRNLEVYFEGLHCCKVVGKKCDKRIEYYLHKIEMCRRIKSKLGLK